MEQQPLARRRRILLRGGLLLVLGSLAAFTLFMLKTFSPTQYSIFPPCMAYKLTGLHCPGCGLTRATHCMLNGEFRQAVAYNLFAPILVPALAFMIGSSIWRWLWSDPQAPISPRTLTQDVTGQRRRGWLAAAGGISILVLFLGFWVLRNIPAYPFNLLAPHELSQ